LGGTDYTATDVEDIITIYDPSLGFTTGGGTFAWPGTGERTNFGYTMKYNQNGTNARGNLLVIRHRADGTIDRLKSNSIEGLALSSATATPPWATFNGKATYQEAGWSTAVGNYLFQVYVEDNDEPGTGNDKVWLQVNGGSVFYMSGSPSAEAQPLTGGNIQVPHE
jgi:hypothetical protein